MAQSRNERMLNEVRSNSYWKIAVLTIVAAVAAVLIGITAMTSDKLTATPTPPFNNNTAAGETPAAPAGNGDAAYFPGQYVNKATEPSEHIQAY